MNAEHLPQSALYHTIHRQPEVIRVALDDSQQVIDRAAERIARARHVFLAGTGTSYHAAIVGEYLLRAAGADAYAATNFDLTCYPRPLDAHDVLLAISHRGNKTYGTRLIAQARNGGAYIVGLTGQGSPLDDADAIIRTSPPEQSSAHTMSYTAALAVLAALADAVGTRTGQPVAGLSDLLPRLPELVAAMLQHEDALQHVAEALAACGRIILAGAGPNAATAREGALKIKETSYLVAEGFELETVLHGGLQAVEPGDVAVVIAADGPALPRCGDLVRALDLLGTDLLLIADEQVIPMLPAQEDSLAARTVVPYPAVPEPLSPLLAVVPLQLLAAYTAAARGTDADSFRGDDPRHKRATNSYAL